MYGWGAGNSGRLGHGGTGSAADVLTPTEITQLSTLNATRGIDRFYIGGYRNFIITDDGAVYGWGANAQADLGNGDTEPVLVPTENTYLTTLNATRGIDRFYLAYRTSIVVTFDGAVYAWGSGNNGQIGNGGTAHVLVPTEVPQLTTLFATYEMTRFNMNHYVNSWYFVTDCYKVYVWGFGGQGRFGNGSTANVLVPTEVPAVSALAQAGAQFFVGGRFVFAFNPVDPISAPLTKTLRMPEGTTVPNASFSFDFTPRQIQLSDTPVTNSRPITDHPTLSPNPVTITINPANAITAGGATTVVGIFDLMNLFGAVTFPSGGIYVWEVNEVEGSSNTISPSTMTYDDAHFQVRVHASSAGVASFIEVFELIDDDAGGWIVGEKVEGINFTNTYRTTTQPAINALEITKTVDGLFADLTIPFEFTLTLTGHEFAPLTFPIGAYHVAADGTETPVSIDASPHPFTLLHGEALRIPEIYVGTIFEVTESAIADFTPSLRVTTGGVQGPIQEGTVNTDLSTEDRIVSDEGNNIAAFTNTHNHTPPTGLVITTAPWVALIVAALLLVVMISSRSRRRIEEMPLVF